MKKMIFVVANTEPFINCFSKRECFTEENLRAMSASLRSDTLVCIDYYRHREVRAVLLASDVMRDEKVGFELVVQMEIDVESLANWSRSSLFMCVAICPDYRVDRLAISHDTFMRNLPHFHAPQSEEITCQPLSAIKSKWG